VERDRDADFGALDEMRQEFTQLGAIGKAGKTSAFVWQRWRSSSFSFST
jgi:hypothetical protein